MQVDGQPAVFLDNPGGTQVPQPVIDAIGDYLAHSNANHGGAFATSQRSDAILDDAHQAVADMLNAASPQEIVFGPNMTTLTFSISRALGREIGPGDEIVVTRMDHDANITPWVMMAEDRGATVRWVDFDVEDYTLDMTGLRNLLNERTKIVAVGYASNALGTVNDVAKITQWAHEVGRWPSSTRSSTRRMAPLTCRRWAVISSPCRPTSSSARTKAFFTAATTCSTDCAPTRFARRQTSLPASSRPARKTTKASPARWRPSITWPRSASATERPFAIVTLACQGVDLNLKTGMSALRAYDADLGAAILDELETLPGIRIHGITDRSRLSERVPTVSFTWQDRHPREIAAALGKQGIFVWDGNYYALAVTSRLGLEGKGGMVRIGAAFYNTLDEIHRLGDALRTLV